MNEMKKIIAIITIPTDISPERSKLGASEIDIKGMVLITFINKAPGKADDINIR